MDNVNPLDAAHGNRGINLEPLESQDLKNKIRVPGPGKTARVIKTQAPANKIEENIDNQKDGLGF